VHLVKEDYPSWVDISPAKQWLVGGGGGWGCDGPEQGFAVGIINKDASGKFTIEMESQLVSTSSCCYHQRSLGEEENAASSEEAARVEEWEAADFKAKFLEQTTCGGLECQTRSDLLKAFRKEERLEGTTTETPVAKELAADAERESGANFETSQFFKDTIEEIKQMKAARAAASSHQVQVE